MKIKYPHSKYMYNSILPILFIIFVVFIFNLSHIFLDTLVKDDGHWYYLYSEGLLDIKPGMVSPLAIFLRFFYSYGMVNWGVPVIRTVYVIILAMCSISFFLFLTFVLGVNKWPALAASILPNILPGLTEIPAGLNSSYAIWGLLPVLVSMLFFDYAQKKERWKSIIMLFVSLIFFMIGMSISSASLFLVPFVALFSLKYLFNKTYATVVYFLFTVACGVLLWYSMSLYGADQPTEIPFETIIYRILLLFNIASIGPLKPPHSSYIAMLLSLIGFIVLLFDKSNEILDAPRNVSRVITYRFYVALLIIIWILGTSIVYVAFAHQFEPYRHSYIFNYGVLLASSISIYWILFRLYNLLRVSLSWRRYINATVLLLIVLFTGYERIHFTQKYFGSAEKISELLRKNLLEHKIPQHAQILILEHSIPHQGAINYNSGYLRYVLGRNDINALIGSNVSFPHDLFAPGEGPWQSMQGFDLNKPVLAFRAVNESLESMPYLFRFYTPDDLRKTRWSIYELRESFTQPKLIISGANLLDYYQYLESSETILADDEKVAFAPGQFSEMLLTADQANELIQNTNNLLHEPVLFNNLIELKLVELLRTDNGHRLRAIIEIANDLPKDFILCYMLKVRRVFAEKIHLIGYGKYASKGNNILFTTPVLSKSELSKGISLQFANRAHKLPLIPLMISDGVLKNQSFVSLEFGYLSDSSNFIIKEQGDLDYNTKDLLKKFESENVQESKMIIPQKFITFDDKIAINKVFSLKDDNISELSYEFLLQSLEKNDFFSQSKTFSSSWPPMPLLANPVAIYQEDVNRYGFQIKVLNNDQNAENWVSFSFDPEQWYKIKFNFNLKEQTISVFINDILFKYIQEVSIDISKLGHITLGRGYLQRFWNGKIAYFTVYDNFNKVYVNIQSSDQ